MRYFLDCEFSERGPRFPLELMSIGVVAEDGREWYRENRIINLDTVNPWVKNNVVPHLIRTQDPDLTLTISDCLVMRPNHIANALFDFVDEIPEFWGYYCAYDWVVICQLFGDMSMLPTSWPMYCHDLRQWLDDQGLQDVKQPDDAPHNALDDARWIAQTFRRLCAEVEVAR